MKNLLLMFSLVVAFCLAAHARITYELSVKGAQAKIVLKVVDQDGVAVPGAKIWGAFSANHLKDSILVDGVSDANGEYVALGKCNEFLRVDVTKKGYYHTEEKINFRKSKSKPIVADGKWQPYGETRTVVLKKIKKLGQLSVPNIGCISVSERHVPKFGCWLPFDLEKFDWTSPYGDGVFPDVLLRFQSRATADIFDYTDCMEVCFTNNQFAGAYKLRKDMFSDMKTCYMANSNAEYNGCFTFLSERTADNKRTEDYLKSDEYMVFRTRTRVDEHGKLVSAHYGAIHGPWLFARDHIRIGDGCFNLIKNNCDIEDGYYLREAVKHYEDAD